MNQIPNIEETHNTREIEEEVEELIDALGVTEHRAIGFVKVIPTHSLRQLLIGHHQQLQKARETWLREEIVRLEGMRNDDLPSTLKDPAGFCKGVGHNKALQTIIDCYQSELDHLPYRPLNQERE